jgi:hypothetical protein
MKIYLTLIFVLVLCRLEAQILNIEKNRAKGDTTNVFNGEIEFNFNLFNRNAGKDDSNNYFNISANSNLIYFSVNHAYLLVGNINYMEVSDNPILQTGYQHFRINLFSHRKLSYELFSQYQYDRIRGLRNRWLGGGGIRLDLIDDENDHLYLGIGIMQEYERWAVPDEENTFVSPSITKSANYMSYQTRMADKITLQTITYYQFGYDKLIDQMRHRITANANIDVGISDQLSLTINFTGVYENNPVIPITKFIYSLSNGLKLKL